METFRSDGSLEAEFGRRGDVEKDIIGVTADKTGEINDDSEFREDGVVSGEFAISGASVAANVGETDS